MYIWTGDADLGTDRRQPGGWIYNVLPYIEQQPLHDLGAGLPAAAKDGANYQRLRTALTMLNCPTRRPVMTFPWADELGNTQLRTIGRGRAAATTQPTAARSSSTQ